MSHFIKGILLGEYPVLPLGTRLLFKAPVDQFQQYRIHMITLGKCQGQNNIQDYILTFASWIQEHRYRHEVRGTWFFYEHRLNKQQVRILRKLNFGSGKNDINSQILQCGGVSGGAGEGPASER